MVGRNAKQVADLLAGVPVNAHTDGLDALRCNAGGRSFSLVQQAHQFPAGFPRLKALVQGSAGKFLRICGLFPAASGGVLQLCIDFIADQAVGVSRKGAPMPGLVGLGRFAQADAPNLKQIIIVVDAALVQGMDTVPYYLLLLLAALP